MKNWTLYRILLDFVPADETLNQSDFSAAETKHIVMALRRNRCLGAALCLFDEKGVTHTLTFGKAHLKPDITVQPDTVFRAASISKFVTGLGIIMAYNLSRKRTGLSPLLGGFGALPFQILVMLCTLAATVAQHHRQHYDALFAFLNSCQ